MFDTSLKITRIEMIIQQNQNTRMFNPIIYLDYSYKAEYLASDFFEY